MSDARECLICGQALEYLQEQQEMVCSFCGKTFLSNTKCRDGHYICDACHEKKGLEEVMHICGGSESKNPLEILSSHATSSPLFLFTANTASIHVRTTIIFHPYM